LVKFCVLQVCCRRVAGALQVCCRCVANVTQVSKSCLAQVTEGEGSSCVCCRCVADVLHLCCECHTRQQIVSHAGIGGPGVTWSIYVCCRCVAVCCSVLLQNSHTLASRVSPGSQRARGPLRTTTPSSRICNGVSKKERLLPE